MKKLGFGLMRLPLTDSNDVTAIDQEHVNKMADHFLEQGFTYFDTAYAYHNGMSEVALNKAVIERHPRESFVVADKMPTFLVNDSSDYDRFWNEQVQRTGLEYFDYYLLHNLGEVNYKNSLKYGGFDYMKQLKAQGKAKKIGFSFHDKAELLEEILANHPEMEFVQLQINYVDWDDAVIQSRKCYELAEKYNKPVIAMTPIKGGLLSDLPPEAEAILQANSKSALSAWALRFAASLPNVFMVLSGMGNLEQVTDNTNLMKDFTPLSSQEREALEKVAKIVTSEYTIPCTACQYCVEDCPQNIKIPDIFAIYNNQARFTFAVSHWNYYMNLTKRTGKASSCVECGACEKLCPQHIEITKELKNMVKVFERERP